MQKRGGTQHPSLPIMCWSCNLTYLVFVRPTQCLYIVTALAELLQLLDTSTKQLQQKNDLMESGGIIYLIYLTAPLRLTWITHPITPNRAVDKFGINGAGIEPWTEYHLDTSINQLS
jgi:hypothetical protein